jgi:hypothetical protein
MTADEIVKRIDAAELTFQQTHVELTIPHIISALRAIAEALRDMESSANTRK